MLHTFVAVCGNVEQFRLTPDGAKESARVLSLALCPEPAEVHDTKTDELLAFYVDGAELHPSLYDLACEGAPAGARTGEDL